MTPSINFEVPSYSGKEVNCAINQHDLSGTAIYSFCFFARRNRLIGCRDMAISSLVPVCWGIACMCVYVCVCMCMYLLVSACMILCACMCMYVHVCACIAGMSMYCRYVHVCMYMPVCVFERIFSQVWRRKSLFHVVLHVGPLHVCACIAGM
jgi:hypothetical protein